MKTLIAYASKYGATRDCALRLAEKFGPDADVVDLNAGAAPDLDGYDRVILGSPMYMGRIQKSVKRLCKDRLEQLMARPFAFFMCGLSDKSEVRVHLSKQLPAKLLDHACAIQNFGGDLRLENAGFMDRFVMEKMQVEKKMEPTFDILAVDAFFERVQG